MDYSWGEIPSSKFQIPKILCSLEFEIWNLVLLPVGQLIWPCSPWSLPRFTLTEGAWHLLSDSSLWHYSSPCGGWVLPITVSFVRHYYAGGQTRHVVVAGLEPGLSSETSPKRQRREGGPATIRPHIFKDLHAKYSSIASLASLSASAFCSRGI